MTQGLETRHGHSHGHNYSRLPWELLGWLGTMKCRVYTGPRGDEGRSGIPKDVVLFSDAETRENFPKQIVAGELAGDLAQGDLGETQVFRQQFSGARLRLIRRGIEVLPGAVQGIEMSPPGA